MPSVMPVTAGTIAAPAIAVATCEPATAQKFCQSRMIEEAAKARQTLAITHDRELIGIIIPITPGLVQFLIEQNMSRVLYNTALGEKEILTSRKMLTLDDALRAAGPPRRA